MAYFLRQLLIKSVSFLLRMAVFTLETNKSSRRTSSLSVGTGRTRFWTYKSCAFEFVNLAVWEDDFSRTTWTSPSKSRLKFTLDEKIVRRLVLLDDLFVF